MIRAISAALGESWEKTYKALVKHSIKTGYFLNTPECYGPFLEENGFKKQKQPVYKNGKKMRFIDFCKKFDGCAVCNCGKGHVTYVAENGVWDIWNCENEIVGIYWVYEND